jgi:hypothetical protein
LCQNYTLLSAEKGRLLCLQGRSFSKGKEIQLVMPWQVQGKKNEKKGCIF